MWVSFFRGYARWSHRRPSKVLMPSMTDPVLKEETIVDLSSYDLSKEKGPTRKFNYKSPTKVPRDSSFDFKQIDKMSVHKDKPKPDAGKKTQKAEPVVRKSLQTVTVIENVFDDSDNFVYKKLSNNDKDIGNLLIKLKSKKERAQCGQVLVEGWRLIADGLLAECQLEKVIVSRLSDLKKLRPFLPETGPCIYKMSYRELQQWSNLDTCPGIMGVFKVPELDKIKVNENSLPINIICDNIREPGNLGAIFRVAVGVGCRSVLLTKGCVDIWEPKVLRSAAGAHFRLRILPNLSWSDIEKQCSEPSTVYIADNNSIADEESREVEIENKSFQFEDRRKSLTIDDSTNLSLTINLPTVPYYVENYALSNAISLVIGGETEGISDECYKFGAERNCTRLNIPLSPGVDSLNVGTALAVIAFEMKRQLLKTPQKATMELSN